MSVTVFHDKFARSWPTLAPEKPWCESDRGRVLSLRDALSVDYLTDAHFTAYHSPNGCRLNSESVAKFGGIAITCAVFDLDGPTHGTPEPAPASWRLETRASVVALAVDHPDPIYYETKGGARLLYKLAEPTILRTKDDAIAWARGYHVAVAHLSRNYGLEADASCSDWQRFYRLPYATRTRGARPERWCLWGDWSRIGTLVIDASHADVDLARSRTTAFRDRSPRALAPGGVGGDGLFYHLLRARGHVGAAVSRGGWICWCPNRSQHTINTDGSDSTIVVPPSDGGETGLILCKHGHCDEKFTVAEWLRFFTKSELDSARRAAGIGRVA